ncbi:MAG: YdcF family protein [Defluviitaleaceae bacterium]|nr:YdcF family protein [Defluviitaleaceae bacterium]
MKSWKAKLILFAGTLSLINVAIQSTASNIHLGFIAQAIISTALILYAVLFDRLPKAVHIAAATACAVPLCFSVFLGAYGRLSGADYTEDVVIVLGAGLRGEEVGSHLANRLDRAVDYLGSNPDAIVVVTGGLGAGAPITEAEAMERYLIASGVSPERIILEDQSTSTYENISFARDILDEQFSGGFRAALISNDFHIYRAVRMARHVGVSAYGVGASTPLFALPQNYLREMLAVAHMWVFSPIRP